MICPERKLLLVEYADAVRVHYEAVRKMIDMADAALGSDLDLIRLHCRNALEQAEQARLTLHRHELNHFCDRLLPSAKT